MAFLRPKISPPSPLLPPRKPLPNAPAGKPLLVFPSTAAAAAKVDVPPLVRDADALREKPPLAPPKPPSLPSIGGGNSSSNKNKDDFYLNLGVAVRTLREDLPFLFSKDLNYDIYREDITFIDPLNTFQGIENYKLIFWALRFHGRILFKEIGVEIFRIWQPSENIILIRWELQGVPRVPWEARGRFQGTSWYKLDRNGKIYEHKVDNLALNFPRLAAGPRTVMDFVAAACPPSPNLTFWDGVLDYESWPSSCSWQELYRAVRETLEQEGRYPLGTGMEGLVTCS